MTVNASRGKFLPDYDDSVVLRDIADGAETATAIEASVALNELDTAWWHDGKDIPAGIAVVHIHVTAAAIDGTDEAYTFDLLVDDAAAMNDTPRAIASLAFAAGVLTPGVYRLPVALDQIKYLDTDSSATEKYLAIRCTHAGSSSSVTYGAFLGKNISG